MRSTNIPGFFITVTWQYPERLSDVLVKIETNNEHLATQDTLRGVVSRVERRVLRGNLLELDQVLQRLKQEDVSTIEAILCYSRGSVAAVSCETCTRTNGGPFGGCIVLSDWFGNACANCIFEHGHQTPGVIDLTGDDEQLGVIFCRHRGRSGDRINNPIGPTCH